MKEKLIAYFNRKLHEMDINPTARNVYFDQAFGALDFACMIFDDWDKEAELVDLWNEEWKPTFEAKVYDDGYAPCELEEPPDIDDDCGFDPYEGCYTYDC